MVSTAQEEVLAVVPARGGSKSIPRKNLRLLAGHPLIAYSIAAGLEARRVTRLIVSTDDPELAAVAKDYGAEVPFMRPDELARDETPDLPVFQHALDWLQEREGYEPDVVVQLRPTSPLRPAGLVDQAVETLLAKPSAESVRGVTVASQTPYKMWKVHDEGFLRPLLDAANLHEPYNMPRQILPQVFWQTGHIDVVRRQILVNHRSLTGQQVLPLVIDRRFCVDIDTEADWTYADWLVSHERLAVIKPKTNRIAPPDNGLRGCLPFEISLVVLDFDGVLTDNRVWVSEQGIESVICNRSDGLGIEMLKRYGVDLFVLSKESNPVVAARCRKLGIPFRQGVEDKYSALQSLAAERKVNLNAIAYVGNDVNDLQCMVSTGCAVAVADAHPEVLQHADLILSAPGGRGAIRELSDLILATDRHVGRKRHG